MEAISGVLVLDSGVGHSRSFSVDIPLIESNARGSVSIWVVLLMSLVGGVILNVMPCVLPILSIKVLSILNHSARPRSVQVKDAAFFCLGMVLSFVGLGVLLAFLRLNGEKLGWGFQLQSPGFVLGISILFLFMALNFFGVFELGTSLGRLSGYFKSSDGYLGSFLSGIFVTVVATPCSAPFMGSAIGIALTQPYSIMILIFGFMGLGMAFPFGFLVLFPSLLSWLPRPGAWIMTLKRFFGLLMLASVLWLWWVLRIQWGEAASFRIFVGYLVLIGCAWLYGRHTLFAGRYQKWRVGVSVSFLVCTVLGLSIYLKNVRYAHVKIEQTEGIKWQSWTPLSLKAALDSGQTVFVNYTAAWCLSCQVNERVVFRSARVLSEFKKQGVIALKADWTHSDSAIEQSLRSFGRAGIPFYLLYRPGKNPEILSEVLTPKYLINKIKN
jgi:thiol:disulfide interchange protein